MLIEAQLQTGDYEKPLKANGKIKDGALICSIPWKKLKGIVMTDKNIS